MPHEYVSPTTKDVRDRYATQFADDLAANETEQASIRSQLDAFTARLDQLEEEHTLLLALRGTVVVPHTTTPEGAMPTEDGRNSAGHAGVQSVAEPAVPRPRRKRGAVQAPRRTPAAKKAAEAPAQSGSEAPGTDGGTGAGAHLTLRAAVLRLLRQHREPRTVREVHEEVTRDYPQFTPKQTVVRDALNAHVAKGRVERERKQNAIWYTAAQPGDQGTTAADAATAPGTTTTAVSETAEENTTAGI
ncbi:BlaI/MecI/CopY family transcriptional regulator [Streptomyces sp. NPDC020965]|uniref:BlaI/MecI/CopY family transcriptional regulator n=1 Tax=Streptomyces sp. NPDC020965 TaxID=3365105 RepID=UPI0037B8CBD0